MDFEQPVGKTLGCSSFSRFVPVPSQLLSRLHEIQGFEAWGEVVGNASAQLLDLYPILRKLPKMIAPGVRHAEELYKKERELYVGHWMDTKNRIEKGTCHVRFFTTAAIVKTLSTDIRCLAVLLCGCLFGTER